MAQFSFSMEYQRDTEMSITPGLNPNMEETRLGIVTIIEQIMAQLIEEVGEKLLFLNMSLYTLQKQIPKWNLSSYPQLQICPLLEDL